ncbi:DUF6542 domain-containing protein [Nocardioides sp. W7]|uniref:DUF6542 domain-containing protein n=1 Tax=Nocardioides sp. W7 TaxID=2931390 RepID=UPI001FD1DBC7|nr:DUF6542 domain-containing protein [Nocardioides sp. W7]
MSGKTLWEQGHEPGRQMVTLGIAAALTVVALDLLLTGRVSVLFDIAFVALSTALALLVRPRDFFTVGVLPPLVMVVVFTLLAATRPGAVAHPDDSVVQALISGLSSHSLALVLGYALCLVCLALRQRALDQHGRLVRPRNAPGHLHPGG